MKKNLFFLLLVLAFSFTVIPQLTMASESADVVEVTSAEIGVSVEAANTAVAEVFATVNESGTLIEIGNTTAEETTIIIRVMHEGESVDQTVQVNSDTKIITDANRNADLSDWIAGDQIKYTAKQGENSGELIALTLKNRSFKNRHFGRNGWIKDIRIDENKMDVEWAGQVYTLDTSDARMVAGLKNPATLDDFKVGDRIRARVIDDNDGNNLTWDAKIIVVLRRGKALFMRVTRWVVPAEIVSIPEDTTRPFVITAKVLPSRFYEKGDVNNLIGAPDTEININIEEKTILVRRFLGRATIGEFMEGDKIRVVGRLNEETGNIDALLVKDNSIQRLGVSRRVSIVKSINTDSKTILVQPIGKKNIRTGKRMRIHNGTEWTIKIDDQTIIKKQGEDIDFTNIAIDDIVRVRGTANRLQKTVEADAISVVTQGLTKVLVEPLVE